VARDILLVMVLPPYDSDEVLGAFQRADYTFVQEKALPHALAGNTDAQCIVALLYQCGLGVEPNFLEAERWLLRATAQNSRLAWHDLGTLYALKIPDLKHRWNDAQACWKRAEELGFACAHPYPSPSR
jgi:TPR repeat protein